MALLVEDDRNDLSSRASIGLVSNLLPAMPEERYLSSGNSVDIKYGEKATINVKFNPVLWAPPKQGDMIFYHLGQPVTFRIIPGRVDLIKLSNILGPDFTSPKFNESIKTQIGQWVIQSYSYSFFGATKFVDVWSDSLGISLIAVMPEKSARKDIEELAAGISISETQVKGLSTMDDSARLAAQVRPSVVMIVDNYCAVIKTLEKTYPFCLAQAGSGFFINKNGYIATNGHVVSNLPDTTILFAVESGSLDNFLIDYFQVYLTVMTGAPVDRSVVEQKVKDAHKNKETIYQMAALVQDLYKKNLLTIANAESHYFVQLGNTPIQISKSGVNIGKDILVATFIDADYAAPDPIKGFNSSDVAILKVEGTNYPVLPLGKIDDVSVGSDVLVVGYPGIVMGSNSMLLDTSANAEPTFTKGVVSSFKQAKGNKKNLIQTDASINHGNSGGPAISSNGTVIGIATYGLIPEQGVGNYNFLRDIADLKELMSKNKISETDSETYTAWKNGLNNYWVAYFKYAKGDFDTVSSLYPTHPTVGKYLKETTAKTDSVEDQTPALSRTQRRLYINLSGGTMIFSILMVIIISIFSFIDSKRRNAPISIPPRPIQTF